MANQRSPDGRLVYLHCSSIFSGANAQVRKAKKISQLLQKHKASIEILTREFTLPAIAAIAKELLEEHIFESLPRARLRYPELFQPSETREAERAASEAEVLRIEAEGAQDIVLTSDDEGGDECLDSEQGERHAEPDGRLKDKADPPEIVQASAIELCRQFTPQAHQALSIPKLHPVYLPFKTKHNILVLVQSLLEECCFEFGNTWVPDLMEARKWHEVESIELTQWTQRFLKYTKSLPSSTIKPIAGKSIAQVLFGTSTLRHSAVHRHPTSAAGIVNMLSAAITFAEALNDSKRADKIAEIKVQLEASIEEIIQHQNLLERKLTDQLEEIARRRAELDELERSSIEEMLTVDKKQRAEVGAALESVLVGYHQVSNPCACNCAPSLDGPKADFEAGENVKSSGIDQEHRTPDVVDKAQAHDQDPRGEEKSLQIEELGNDNQPPWLDKSDSDVEEERELTLPVVRLKGKKKRKKGKKAAALGWDIPAAEEASVLVDEAPDTENAPPSPAHIAQDMASECPRMGILNFGATIDDSAEPHDRAGESIPNEEPCFEVPEGASPEAEPYIIAPKEDPLPEAAFPIQEAISKEHPGEYEEVALEPTLEASQAEPVIEGFDDGEEQSLNQYDNIPQNLDNPYGSIPEPDIAIMHSASAEDAEFLVPPPRPAFSGAQDKLNSHPPPPSAPSSTVTSVLEAAAPEAPTEDSHTITLKIFNGSKALRSIVFITACTRTAILNEARAYCMKCAQDDQSLGSLLAKGWDLALVSLKMYGYDMDMSTYKVENLSSLIRAIEKTGIPRFTLRISEI